MTSIDRMARHLEDYDYAGFPDTVKYILQVIFIWIIKEQCSDLEESK
jgi:hypothetical protein